MEKSELELMRERVIDRDRTIDRMTADLAAARAMLRECADGMETARTQFHKVNIYFSETGKGTLELYQENGTQNLKLMDLTTAARAEAGKGA